MVVSLSTATLTETPKYYSPYYEYPENGTPNFGKPFHFPCSFPFDFPLLGLYIPDEPHINPIIPIEPP